MCRLQFCLHTISDMVLSVKVEEEEWRHERLQMLDS